jgi:AcrR family transcriptional regulator
MSAASGVSRRSGAARRASVDGGSYPQVAGIQRSRLLAAAIRSVDELGYTETTVAQITSRARVSRRTFYELFDNREDCLLAILDDVAARIERDLEEVAGLARLSWRVRVREGLWRILRFLDEEPALARVCVVRTVAGGPVILARREELLARLIAVVDEGRRCPDQANATACSLVTAEGVVGAVLAVIHGRLARGDRELLVGLLGELMGMIVLPYQGTAVARREQRRPAPTNPPGLRAQSTTGVRGGGDVLAGLPMRLTYRTTRVLESVSEHPGLSNRRIGDIAGIPDQGQVSKLLARLERLELLQNTRAGEHVQGEPNAWHLTVKGRFVTENIRMHIPTSHAVVA